MALERVPADIRAQGGVSRMSDPDMIDGIIEAVSIPVIASGGIHHIGYIQTLLDARAPGIIGAITGRAIYEGTLDVAEAQALCDNAAASHKP